MKFQEYLDILTEDEKSIVPYNKKEVVPYNKKEVTRAKAKEDDEEWEQYDYEKDKNVKHTEEGTEFYVLGKNKMIQVRARGGHGAWWDTDVGEYVMEPVMLKATTNVGNRFYDNAVVAAHKLAEKENIPWNPQLRLSQKKDIQRKKDLLKDLLAKYVDED